MDETAFRTGIGGKQNVITRSACRRAFTSTSTYQDSVTVVECFNALANICHSIRENCMITIALQCLTPATQMMSSTCTG
jgi:hypothetical protein